MVSRPLSVSSSRTGSSKRRSLNHCVENYLQNPLNDPLRPGALGLGQASATNLSYLFSLLVYTVPVFSAVIIDCYLGSIYLVGALVLLLTSLPVSLAAGAGLPGYVTAVIIIGIGLGGVKTSISPFMDLSFVLLVRAVHQTWRFFLMSIPRAIQVGSVAGLATTFLEKDVGFWAAYLLPFCVLWVSVLTLWICRDTFGTYWSRTGESNRFDMEMTRPAKQRGPVDWDDTFVTDLQRALIACRVFAMTPVLWLCHLQLFNNLVSQAGQMQTGGLPNDVFMNINPLAVLVFLPLVQNVVYPALRRMRIAFPPVNRITVGFVIETIAISYCAGVQKLIYSKGPCFDDPLGCSASDGGRIPNQISVWVQAPVYIIDALGEVFFDLASQEYAYNKAPKSMKSIIQAILSASIGVGMFLGLALRPVTQNPYLVYMYSALAGAMALTTVLFWCFLHKYNSIDAELNQRGSADISDMGDANQCARQHEMLPVPTKTNSGDR
nr:putative peptide transporter ptr2 [Quercus suber]